MKKSNVYFWIVLIFSVIGAIVAFYSVLAHYGAASYEFCSINETFSCDIVNSSSYSELLGIPVSVLGLVAYIFFFGAAIVYRKKKIKILMDLMVFGSVFGMLFSLYLSGIEAFVLYTWCLLCIASQISIFVVLLAILGWRYSEKVAESPKQNDSCCST